MNPIKRIHHISATVGDPNENLQFYKEILGLRLVKQTVNFEDEATYHLYFANQNVDDGSIMTFFPLTNNLTGRTGAGQVRRIAFAVPKNTLNEWEEDLKRNNIDFERGSMFGIESLNFNDSHGIFLALIETDTRERTKDILGFYGVELLSEQPDKTYELLTKDLGLHLIEETKEAYLLEMSGKEKHKVLVNRQLIKRGRLGIGTVHHIAWSISDERQLINWKRHFEDSYRVTDIKDRKYFKSAYFRDPGHIIYELATDGPGFTVDENINQLGERLMLPEEHEKKRNQIKTNLPELNL